MNDKQKLLDKIKVWMEENPKIGAAILVGSRVRNDHPSDQYSDYDIEVYAENPEELTNNEAWLEIFDEVWVVVRDKTEDGFPTRLVIYDEGLKVDFSLRSIRSLRQMVEGGVRPNYYRDGYDFLVDKEGLVRKFEGMIEEPVEPTLSDKEFRRVVEEFWFEAWHVAKYLKREELWVAKSRDAGMKEFLRQMIEWRAMVVNKNEVIRVWPEGRFMQEWVDRQTWQDLKGCFGHFEAGDSWQSLEQTMKMFRRLAGEVAEKVGYQYPEKVDRKISSWIMELRG